MDKETEIKKLMEENKKMAELCAVKADIVSMSAHQIRTALSGLKWIIKMFLDGDLGKLTAEQENLISKAYDSNDRAIGIVSELLLANKTEDIAEKKYIFSEVDLTELIDNSIFDFSGEANAKGIQMIFLKPEIRLSLVHGDKEKLRVVFQNLLENAIKYSNGHGKIFMALREKDKIIEFSIKDIGICVPDENKSRIFEKFYRDPEARKKDVIGSGIGLFNAKKIIEEHGGKMWFESEKDTGTTFFFSIPISK